MSPLVAEALAAHASGDTTRATECLLEVLESDFDPDVARALALYEQHVQAGDGAFDLAAALGIPPLDTASPPVSGSPAASADADLDGVFADFFGAAPTTGPTGGGRPGPVNTASSPVVTPDAAGDLSVRAPFTTEDNDMAAFGEPEPPKSEPAPGGSTLSSSRPPQSADALSMDVDPGGDDFFGSELIVEAPLSAPRRTGDLMALFEDEGSADPLPSGMRTPPPDPSEVPPGAEPGERPAPGPRTTARYQAVAPPPPTHRRGSTTPRGGAESPSDSALSGTRAEGVSPSGTSIGLIDEADDLDLDFGPRGSHVSSAPVSTPASMHGAGSSSPTNAGQRGVASGSSSRESAGTLADPSLRLTAEHAVVPDSLVDGTNESVPVSPEDGNATKPPLGFMDSQAPEPDAIRSHASHAAPLPASGAGPTGAEGPPRGAAIISQPTSLREPSRSHPTVSRPSSMSGSHASAPHTSPSDSRPTASSTENYTYPEMLRVAREARDRSDLALAIEWCDRILEAHPGDPAALSLRGEAMQLHGTIQLSRLQPLDRVPRLIIPIGQVWGLRLEPHVVFLLTQIDGVSTLADLVDLSGLPASEAANVLLQLSKDGIIAF